MSASSKTRYGIKPRQWLPVVMIVLVIYIIAPQLKVFHASLQQLHKVDYWQLSQAFGAIGLTFVFGALAYKTLAFKPLDYGRTLVAQIAANFINRLLPAGLGGIGANYRYFRRQKHTAAQAAGVVAVNNSLGLIGHLLLVLVLVTIFNAHVESSSLDPVFWLTVAIALVVAVTLLALLPNARRRARLGLVAFAKQLKQYRTRPATLTTALLFEIFLTLANITAFWLCVLAVHASLSFVTALLVFTFGFGVGNATPTPGGLGGVEAGLVAGLVAYHIASPTALAAVLVYRLVSYWLPLAISGLFFAYASKQRYFS